MSCTTLQTKNGVFPSSSPPTNAPTTSSSLSPLHCRTSSNGNNLSSTDNQNNNNSYTTRTRRTSFSSCKRKSLELSSSSLFCSPSPPATKPLHSNGGSSFGLRRRYSFESFELKKGSSSGSWPKFSQGFKATTLETIPPSPIGEHPGFLLTSEDTLAAPGNDASVTQVATETSTPNTNISPLFNAETSSSVTPPLQPPLEPPSSLSTSSSTLLETHHDNKSERKVSLGECEWPPSCQKPGSTIMLKAETYLDYDRPECSVTDIGKSSQEELPTTSSPGLHCDKLINAKVHDDDDDAAADDEDDDETFGFIIKSPMHTVNFLLDELFYESVIAFKYFKSGASWLLQSYYDIPAFISTKASTSSSSSSSASVIPTATPPAPTFLRNIINFQQSKYIEKLLLLLAIGGKGEAESGPISQSTEQTLSSTEGNGKSDTSPETSSVGEEQAEAEQVKDQKVTNDPYDNDSNTPSSSWFSTNTIKKLGDYVTSRRTTFMTSSLSSTSDSNSGSSSEFVASTLFAVAIALIVLVTTLLLLTNMSVVTTGTERRVPSTKFMHVDEQAREEKIPFQFLDQQKKNEHQEKQQHHNELTKAPAGDSLPYDSNGKTGKSSCSNRIAHEQCLSLQGASEADSYFYCKSTAGEVEAKSVQLQKLGSTTTTRVGIGVLELKQAFRKKESEEQAQTSQAQFDKQERAVWFVLSVLFTILSSSCCLTLFLVYLNRTHYHCCSQHQHTGNSNANNIIHVGSHCKSDPTCIREHVKFANTNQCLADHKLGDNSRKTSQLSSSSALVVSSSPTLTLYPCKTTTSTRTATVLSHFPTSICSSSSHSLSLASSSSTLTSYQKGSGSTLNSRLVVGDLFEKEKETSSLEEEKILQGYHDAPTSSDPLSLAQCQEQHKQNDQYKNTRVTVCNRKTSDRSSEAYPCSQVGGGKIEQVKKEKCDRQDSSGSPFDFDDSIGKRSRTNYSTCLCNSKRADKRKNEHDDDNNSSTKSASVIVAIDDDNNDGHSHRGKELVLSHRQPRPHDVAYDNDYNGNGNGYEDTKNIWLLGKFKSLEGVDCDDGDEKSTNGQHIYEHCSSNQHHCSSLVASGPLTGHKESGKEEFSSAAHPSCCVYYYFNYFLDKFSQPDKVLFPIFWTAFLVDFNFPNCTLLHAIFLALAIKLINLYHHYCYFSRFWGGDIDVRTNASIRSGASTTAGKDSSIRPATTSHQPHHCNQHHQGKSPLPYSSHEADSSKKKSLGGEKKSKSVQEEKKEREEKIRENVGRKKNDHKVFWAGCHQQKKEEKEREGRKNASDERKRKPTQSNLVDDSNSDNHDVSKTRAAEADKSDVSTHICPCPYSTGPLYFSTPFKQQYGEIAQEKLHFSVLLLFPPRKNNLLGSSSKLTIWLLVYFIVIRRLGSLIWFGWPVFTHILGILGLFLGQLCVERLSWCKTKCCSSCANTPTDFSYTSHTSFLQKANNSGTHNILHVLDHHDELLLRNQNRDRHPHQDKNDDDFISQVKESCKENKKVRIEEFSSLSSLDNKRDKNDDDPSSSLAETVGRSRRNYTLDKNEPSASFALNKGSNSSSPPSIISNKEGKSISKKSTTSKDIPYKRSRSVLSFSDFNSSLAGKNTRLGGADHSICCKSDSNSGARRITFNLDSLSPHKDSNYSRVLSTFTKEGDNITSDNQTPNSTIVGQSRSYNPSSLFSALPDHSSHSYRPQNITYRKPSQVESCGARPTTESNWTLPITSSGANSHRGARHYNNNFVPEGNEREVANRNSTQLCVDNWADSSSGLTPTEENGGACYSRNNSISSSSDSQSTQLHSISGSSSSGSLVLGSEESSSHHLQEQQAHVETGSTAPGENLKELPHKKESNSGEQAETNDNNANIVQVGGEIDPVVDLALGQSASSSCVPLEKRGELLPSSSSSSSAVSVSRSNCKNNSSSLSVSLGALDSFSGVKVEETRSDFKRATFRIGTGGSTDEEDVSSILYYKSNSNSDNKEEDCVDEVSMRKTLLVFGGAEQVETSYGENIKSPHHFPFQTHSHFHHQHSHSSVDPNDHMNCKGKGKNNNGASGSISISTTITSPPTPPPSAVSQGTIFYGNKSYVSQKYIGNEDGGIVVSDEAPFSTHSYLDRSRSGSVSNEQISYDESNCTSTSSSPPPPPTLFSSMLAKRLFQSGSQCFVSSSSSPVLHSSTPPQQLLNHSHHQNNHNQQQQGPLEKYLGSKMRRTSLPAALPAQRTAIHHGSAGVDTALLYEAHGLVTEMLLDQAALPPNIVAGLKALATLLKPQPTSSIHYPCPRPKPVPLTLSIDPDYISDIGEIPYTGEKISTIPKRNAGQGKKGVSANLLRRMSTSTWTTTTSATGMPTLEPQPNNRRRRSASFRSSAMEGTPGSSPTQQPSGLLPLALLEKESKLMSMSSFNTSHKSGSASAPGSASVISLSHLSSASVSAIISQSSVGAALHHHNPPNAALQASHKARSFSANALYASTDLTHLSALAASTGFSSGGNAIKSASASVSAAGSNRSSPASTPIPSPAPSPVPSRDPSPCNHRSGGGGGSRSCQHRDSLPQQEGNVSSHSSSTNLAAGSSAECIGPGSMLYQRTSPSQSPGTNRLSLKSSFSGSSGTVGGTTSGSSSSSVFPNPNSSSPPNCRQRDYSPPKVLFHSSCKPEAASSSFAVIGSSVASGGPDAGIDGDSLGLLSGKNPDEDNCSTTSTLGDGPGPPDNSSGNSNSLRLSPVTFTVQEPPDNEPYFSADDDVSLCFPFLTIHLYSNECISLQIHYYTVRIHKYFKKHQVLYLP
ncbi:unnamed protein product [Orchesella dallaii]|uniref:Transmembrane protein n=1 Tax=Orchesella dallaii TaxID=48710 RepID=A0ABP1PN01_9HEXA